MLRPLKKDIWDIIGKGLINMANKNYCKPVDSCATCKNFKEIKEGKFICERNSDVVLTPSANGIYKICKNWKSNKK